MKKIRILFFMISLLLCLALLASCVGEGPEPSENGGSSGDGGNSSGGSGDGGTELIPPTYGENIVDYDTLS